MTLTVANFIQNLETFDGREFRTIFQQKPFRLIFHDTTKLRIGLEQRDISVPISILLFGIAQLLAVREFDRLMCKQILGKDWGFPFVARLLLECEDVCLKPNTYGTVLTRIKIRRPEFVPIRPLDVGTVARNPGNGHNA